jgi:hypothetical protein
VRFSTSSFDNRPANRAIALLLITVFLYFATLETVTRAGLSRISRIQSRISADLKVARSIRQNSPGQPQTALVVGNSLLLEGVDRESLKRDVAPKYLVDLTPIEGTWFEDWYFGLRRIFAEGARPTFVVFCLSTTQMMSRATDGEYFAYYLMQGSDLFAVKREAGLDNTTTSAYFFAHFSKWLGSRDQIRNWLTRKIMPSLDQLVDHFAPRASPLPPRDRVVDVILPRLIDLNALCDLYGARLVVVIPPSLGADDGSTEVRTSAARYDIAVLVPLKASEVAASDFRDGFHLNSQGQAKFTPRLASELIQNLNYNSKVFGTVR